MRRLLPDEDELVLPRIIDVQLLLGLRLLLLHVGPGRTGHLRVGVDARHVRPHRRDEEERDGDHQKVDHRDHVDLRVERLALASASAADVYATHDRLLSAGAAPLTLARSPTTGLSHALEATGWHKKLGDGQPARDPAMFTF